MLQHLKVHIYELWGLAFLSTIVIVLFLLDIDFYHLVLLTLAYAWPFALFVPGIDERVSSKKYRFSFYKMIYTIDQKCLTFLDETFEGISIFQALILRTLYPILFVFLVSGLEFGLSLLFVLLGGGCFAVYLFIWFKLYNHSVDSLS